MLPLVSMYYNRSVPHFSFVLLFVLLSFAKVFHFYIFVNFNLACFTVLLDISNISSSMPLPLPIFISILNIMSIPFMVIILPKSLYHEVPISSSQCQVQFIILSSIILHKLTTLHRFIFNFRVVLSSPCLAIRQINL